jgi:hypothetical protein
MRRILLTVLAGALLLVPVALAGNNSLTILPSAPTTATGVHFGVTVGGNRDFIAVEVTCGDAYGTIVNVPVDADGVGTSQTIYPPAGTCEAQLQIRKQQLRARVLDTKTFTVLP